MCNNKNGDNDVTVRVDVIKVEKECEKENEKKSGIFHLVIWFLSTIALKNY